MAGKVEDRGPAAAELGEEGDVHMGVEARAACLVEGALLAVLAPVDGESDRIWVCCVGGDGEERPHCKEQLGGDAKKLAAACHGRDLCTGGSIHFSISAFSLAPCFVGQRERLGSLSSTQPRRVVRADASTEGRRQNLPRKTFQRFSIQLGYSAVTGLLRVMPLFFKSIISAKILNKSGTRTSPAPVKSMANA